MNIELDANGDKEQPHQHIAERFNVFFHLQPKFRLGNQHAGDKSTQCQ